MYLNLLFQPHVLFLPFHCFPSMDACPVVKKKNSLDVTSAKLFHFWGGIINCTLTCVLISLLSTPLGRTWSVLLLFLCSKLSLYFSPSDRTWHIAGSLNMLTEWKKLYKYLYEVFNIYIYVFSHICILFQII